MNRCSLIRSALSLSQPQLGEMLGVSQAHISRMEGGQSYSRALDILLDRIAREHGLDHLTAERFNAEASPLPVSPFPDGGAGVPLVRRVASGEGSAPREGGA